MLIVTIPSGIASFRFAGFVVWPFGRTTTWRRNAGVWSVIGNIVWIVFFGWELAPMHLIAGLLLMITIIGIPFGVACRKTIPFSLVPLGREIVAHLQRGQRPLRHPRLTSVQPWPAAGRWNALGVTPALWSGRSPAGCGGVLEGWI